MDVELVSHNMPSDSGAESDDFAAAAEPTGQPLFRPRSEVDVFARCVPRPAWTPRLWRSQGMTRGRLFVERENAPNLVRHLGRLACVQFVDLNHGMLFVDRAFTGDIRDCDETDRKMRALRSLLRQRGVAIPRTVLDLEQHPQAGLDAYASQTLEDLQQSVARVSALEKSQEELLELLVVVRYVKQLLENSARPGGAPQEERAPPMMLGEYGDEEEEAVDTSFVAGVGTAASLQAFERVLWRATRGNALLCRKPHPELDGRSVFVVWFTSGTVERKIRKLCEAFCLNMYNVPAHVELESLAIEVEGRLAEMGDVAQRSQRQLSEQMEELASKLFTYEFLAAQDKAVFHSLNMFQVDVGRKVLMAEFWVPTGRCDELVNFVRARESDAPVKTVLDLDEATSENGGEAGGGAGGHGESGAGGPPTVMATNRFTKAFNSVVDTYATASYGEVNPAVFTIATFPFLFGIMFGDVGHGLLLLFGILGVFAFEGRLLRLQKDELGQFGTVFRARYLVLLMAIASIYCGFLYNEFFALPMNLQWSQWSPVDNSVYWVKNPNATFAFGVDPVWKVASNELQFYNSLKMKLSIVVAYLHMMLGLVLHAFNAVHFRRPYDLYYEFIPRALFLTCIVGYMVLLIFWKWLTNWSLVQPFPPNVFGNGASGAPYIIGVMTNMFLKPFDFSPSIDCEHMLGCPQQDVVQLLLVLIAIACVPTMLLVKPLLLRRDARRRNDHSFEFGEVMIHQVIETIEFVLGAISNTASYLRLWALSLAHSELSIVFYEKILVTAMAAAADSPGVGAAIVLVVGWAAWGAFTLGVLLAMEGLSAFLHTLRLHWVEFQSKFYKGNGVKFKPFSYAALLEQLVESAAEETQS